MADASGTIMDITGKALIDIWVPQLKRSYKHPFYILNSELNNKILLGRDFMTKIGLVSFDFAHDRVQLGKQWVNCVPPTENKGIRLKSKTVIPSRSEIIITLQSAPSLTFVNIEFEPKRLQGIRGV